MNKYTVVSNGLELPRGAKIMLVHHLTHQALQAGELYLFKLGSFLILGRWFPPGWIVQPGRFIEIGKVVCKVLGHARHLL